MKALKPLIASAVLLSISSAALALTQDNSIEINVTEAEYLNVTGSIVNDALATLDIALITVANGTDVVGTLGADSNVSGTCDVTMTTTNAFELIHTNGTTALHATPYSITYDGNTYTPTVSAGTTDCSGTTGLTSNVVFNGSAVTGTILAGTYSDTLNITIATQ